MHDPEESGTTEGEARGRPPGWCATGRSSGGLAASVPSLRAPAEFFCLLLIGITIARTFVAEAYIVPTGSMAPTLLGMHQARLCGNCGHRYLQGVSEDGGTSSPVCPNCGISGYGAPAVFGCGDRLLVHKFLFDLRQPKRWEAVVFQSPSDPTQAYVKRVAGLPGERVLLADGELFINGQIARKTPEQAKALQILVYDHDCPTADAASRPRWLFRRSWRPGNPLVASDWQSDGPLLFRESSSSFAPFTVDWASYRHWQPDRADYGPVLDYVPYNGFHVRGENRVEDLTLEASVTASPNLGALHLRWSYGIDRIEVKMPINPAGAITATRNRKPLECSERPEAASELERLRLGSEARLEGMLVDRRLYLRLDGLDVIEPIDLPMYIRSHRWDESPLAIGASGPGEIRLRGVKIYRDIYYTDSLATGPGRAFGVEEPFHLGSGEYFVLGDNSPVSNDSRFWEQSPVVPRDMLLGKPFLVHIPSRAVPLEVWGHELYWIPDPREIRYIH